jgi:phage shock protein A
MTQEELALALDAMALEYGDGVTLAPPLEFAHPRVEAEARENIVTCVQAACAQAEEAMQMVRGTLARSIDRVRPLETGARAVEARSQRMHLDLLEMKTGLADAKKSCAVLIADEKRLAKAIATKRSTEAGWREHATRAHASGNADLERRCSAHADTHEATAIAMAAQSPTLTTVLEDFKVLLRRLNDRVEERSSSIVTGR